MYKNASWKLLRITCLSARGRNGFLFVFVTKSLFLKKIKTKTLTEHSSARMRGQHARENNHLNLHSSVSVYISFEKRIFATSCRIHSSHCVHKILWKEWIFVILIVRSIKTPPLRFSSFSFLVIFGFYQTISAASHGCVYRCKRMCLMRLSK